MHLMQWNQSFYSSNNSSEIRKLAFICTAYPMCISCMFLCTVSGHAFTCHKRTILFGGHTSHWVQVAVISLGCLLAGWWLAVQRRHGIVQDFVFSAGLGSVEMTGCTHACMCVCLRVRVHTYMYARVCVHMHVCVCLHASVCTLAHLTD